MGGQKVEKVLDGQLGSCVRGQPDRSDSRQMSTTVSRKEKIPLEIEVQCCKSFIGLTFCLTCDGEILEIWISIYLQTSSKRYVRDGKHSNVCMYEIELQIWSQVLLTSILYLEDFGPINKCRKCKCYYSYLCSLNSLTS